MNKILDGTKMQKKLIIFGLSMIVCGLSVDIFGMARFKPMYHSPLYKKNLGGLPTGAFSEGIFKVTMPPTLFPGKTIEVNRVASPTNVTTDLFDDMKKEVHDTSLELHLKADDKIQTPINRLRTEITSDDARGLVLHTVFDAENNVIFEVIYDKQQRKIFEVVHLNDEHAIVIYSYTQGILNAEVIAEYDVHDILIEKTIYDAHRNLMTKILYHEDRSYAVENYNGSEFVLEEQNYDAHDILMSKVIYNNLGYPTSQEVYNGDGSYILTAYTGKNLPYLETEFNRDNQVIRKTTYNGKGVKVDETTL